MDSKVHSKVQVSEDEEKLVESIKLTETTTITLLSLPGMVVASDAKERQGLQVRNERYEALLCERAKGHHDHIGTRHTQTIGVSQKSKEMQAVPLATTKDCGCLTTTFDIYDEYRMGEGESGEEGGLGKRLRLVVVRVLVLVVVVLDPQPPLWLPDPVQQRRRRWRSMSRLVLVVVVVVVVL